MYTWRNFRTTANARELENIREFTSYAIQSQYSASKKILALAAGFQQRIDPHVDVDLFYDTMFNIYTAQGFGLDNWGVILQIGRTIPGPYAGDCFGFTEMTLGPASCGALAIGLVASPGVNPGSQPSPSAQDSAAAAVLAAGMTPVPGDSSGQRFHPFDQLPFVPDAGTPPGISMITLDDELFRLLLLYKALANISASDAATQNKLLSVLIDTGIGGFGGVAYVLEVGAMVIRWVFEDAITPLQLAVFQVVGTLARGAGVGWELYALSPGQVFGFVGSGMQPFNQAPFAGDKSLIIHRS